MSSSFFSSNDRRGERKAPRLRLLPGGLPPLPALVPILRPDEDVTPAQDVLLSDLARRARRGDDAARDLLWRVFSPKLEPAIRRCERLAWRMGWPRRDGQPWELEDVRQEAWLIFAALVAAWRGEGALTPYLLSHFSWRLRTALRRLGPPRVRTLPLAMVAEIPAIHNELTDVEAAELRSALLAELSPTDAAVLRLRLIQGASFADVACQLGVSRRTVARRWARIRRVARGLFGEHRPDNETMPGNRM